MPFKYIFLIAVIITAIYLFIGVLAIVHMQPDYFIRIRTKVSLKNSHSGMWWIAKIFKNLLGLLLITAGGIMLIAPGQGLLTILMGILLMDFPGKRKIEKTLVRHPSVYQSINWIRKKAGKPPIKIP